MSICGKAIEKGRCCGDGNSLRLAILHYLFVLLNLLCSGLIWLLTLSSVTAKPLCSAIASSYSGGGRASRPLGSTLPC